jgi:hypothetical protein
MQDKEQEREKEFRGCDSRDINLSFFNVGLDMEVI